MKKPAGEAEEDRRRGFATTRWTMVLAARDPKAPDGEEALQLLCREYWYPVYAYVRRVGRSSADAEDLTQSFFARLLEKEFLKAAAPEKGRFRTFLLVALKRFLAKEWHRDHAQKRGGYSMHLSIDSLRAEERYGAEAAMSIPAEELFDRRWALTLIEVTLRRLREEYEAKDSGELFSHLKVFLMGAKGDVPVAEAAEAAGISGEHARVMIHRIRKRFREIFRDEISQTVREPSEVEEEIRYLRKVLARSDFL